MITEHMPNGLSFISEIFHLKVRVNIKKVIFFLSQANQAGFGWRLQSFDKDLHYLIKSATDQEM